MTPITMSELTYVFATLANIKKPSPRIKKAKETLEDHICTCIEGMVKNQIIQVPPAK